MASTERFQQKRFLVECFGNPQGLLSFMRTYADDLPGEAAVEKWFYRESIPSVWLPKLLAYLEIDRGTPVSMASYLGVR